MMVSFAPWISVTDTWVNQIARIEGSLNGQDDDEWGKLKMDVHREIEINNASATLSKTNKADEPVCSLFYNRGLLFPTNS